MAVQTTITADKGERRPLPHEKATVLKMYEGYCYQVAFFMLRDELQAAEAAKQALAALYKCAEWFELPDRCRKARAKQEALLHSLEYRKRSLSRAL